MPNSMLNPYIFQEQVGEWGERTFPHATLSSIFNHMAEEVAELLEAIRACDTDNIMEELADVQLMSIHIAHKLNRPLIDAVVNKFNECQTREWGEPDELGIVRHIKQETRAE